MKINNQNVKAPKKPEKIRKPITYEEHFTESCELHNVAKQVISKGDRDIQENDYEKANSRMGQTSVEISLFIHFIQMIYTGIIFYIFLEFFSTTLLYLFLISGFIDLIALAFLIYFFIKFRSTQTFCNIPRSFFITFEYVNSTNLLLKTFNICLVYGCTTKNKLFLYICFYFKYLIDLTFCFVSLRILKFLSCSIWLNNQLFSLFRWIKNTLFCCNNDENFFEEEEGFKRNEVLESNY